jgi:hypothetical protein
VAVLTALLRPAYAAEIHVPGDQPSIGAAIAAAQPGDTVIVADGVWTGPDNRDMTYGGKDIVVRSANGPANCIIDCQMQGRGFFFGDGETRAAVLEGFTITNGFADFSNGGGVDIGLSTSPTIRNCVFLNNVSEGLGGGMAVRGQCTPLIDRCTFINNSAIAVQESSEGGGLSLFFLSPATVTNCVFIDNFADYGGGLGCGLSDGTIVNCLFVGNTAAVGGGGVASDVANPRLVNCTFTDNVANFGGAAAGISQILISDLTMRNCILWDNFPNEITVLNGTANVRYSDVQGGWTGVGNINTDPSFVGATLTVDPAEYALSGSSPCIDAGENASVPSGISTDLAGLARFVDDPETKDTGSGPPPVVDIGAFEFQVESTCPADFDGNGVVGTSDLLLLLSNWGQGGVGDLDGSGAVGTPDLLMLLEAWGPCPE